MVSRYAGRAYRPGVVVGLATVSFCAADPDRRGVSYAGITPTPFACVVHPVFTTRRFVGVNVF